MIIIDIVFVFNFTLIILELIVAFKLILIVTIAASLLVFVVVCAAMDYAFIAVQGAGGAISRSRSRCANSIIDFPTVFSVGLLTIIAATIITLIFTIFAIIILLLLWWWVRRLRLGCVSHAASKTIFGHFIVISWCGAIYDAVAVT